MIVSRQHTTRQQWRGIHRAERIADKVRRHAPGAVVQMNPLLMQAYEDCGWVLQWIPLSAPVRTLTPQITIFGRPVQLNTAVPVGQVVTA